MFGYPAAQVIEMEGTMPIYRNKENGQEMEANEEFAAVALSPDLYELVSEETHEERVQRELKEARDAKVEPPDPEFDYQGQHEAPDQDGV